MISYKDWTTLNESFIGTTFASAVARPHAVGGVVGATGGTEAIYGERKFCNKFMDAGGFGKPEEPPMGGGEDDDLPPPEDEGDFPPPEDEGEGEEEFPPDGEEGEGDFPPEEGEEGEEDEEGDGGFGGPPPMGKKPPFMKGGPMKEGKFPPSFKKEKDGKGKDKDKECCDGEDKGKKLPPWMKKDEKSEAKSTGGFDPEGEQVGKVLPWLNRKGNHGAQDKKTAQEKLQKLSDKVKKEAAATFDDYFFASLKDQIGTPQGKQSSGFSVIPEDALVQAVRTDSEDTQPGPGEIGFAPTGRIFQLAGMADDEGNFLPTLGESVKKK